MATWTSLIPIISGPGGWRGLPRSGRPPWRRWPLAPSWAWLALSLGSWGSLGPRPRGLRSRPSCLAVWWCWSPKLLEPWWCLSQNGYGLCIVWVFFWAALLACVGYLSWSRLPSWQHLAKSAGTLVIIQIRWNQSIFTESCRKLALAAFRKLGTQKNWPETSLWLL